MKNHSCNFTFNSAKEKELNNVNAKSLTGKLILGFEMRLFKNFGIELSSQEVPLQVLSSIYNVSQLSSRWISVVPLSTLKTPKQN